MFYDMLKSMLFAYGPSGHERCIGEVIKKYVAPAADECYFDPMGNLIALKRGTSGKRVMISAHMDEIGLIATGADENGFIRVLNIGGVTPYVAIARRVKFSNGVMGVTLKKGIFDNPEMPKNSREWTINDVMIDIGATTKAEAEAKVQIGDIAVFCREYTELGSNISCGILDDRLCCAVVAETFINAETNHDLYAVFTVQEEVGLRGAGAAAYSIEPHIAFNMDVTASGDTPKCLPMEVKLGHGPTVKIIDSSLVCSPQVRAFMEQVAVKNGIPYQREVLAAGGTDTAAIQRTRGGIRSGCISIPTRYIHTPVETVSRDDIRNSIKLLSACIVEDELPLL